MVAETSRIVNQASRQERDDALKPISKQLGALAHELTAEISGAHLLTNNDELHKALDSVTAAALKGPESEMAYKNIIVVQGQKPNPAPLYGAMEAVHQQIGEARRRAGRLLVTGFD